MRALRERVKDLLAAAGMQETVSYSVTNLDTLRSVDALDNGPEPLRLYNPMSSEFEYLRTSLRGSVLRTLLHNRRNSQNAGLRLFEIGSVYLPKDEARERDLPEERPMLVGVLSGPRNDVSWLTQDDDMGFFDAKGVLEAVFGHLSLAASYERSSDSIMHPGRTASVSYNGRSLGVVGELHPAVLERFDLEGRVTAMFEIDLSALNEVLPRGGYIFQNTSRFPEAYRDIALLVDRSVTSDQIQRIVQRHKLVVHSTPFDVYAGQGVPAGKKSMAYRVTFRSDQATLTSEQVDNAQGDILRQLQRELNAELRS
jgi:phenylalanyl-tRNA synthetase beta chain